MLVPNGNLQDKGSKGTETSKSSTGVKAGSSTSVERSDVSGSADKASRGSGAGWVVRGSTVGASWERSARAERSNSDRGSGGGTDGTDEARASWADADGLAWIDQYGSEKKNVLCEILRDGNGDSADSGSNGVDSSGGGNG